LVERTGNRHVRQKYGEKKSIWADERMPPARSRGDLKNGDEHFRKAKGVNLRENRTVFRRGLAQSPESDCEHEHSERSYCPH